MTAANLSIQLLLLVSVGLFVRWRKMVAADFDKQLTAFLMNICLPCMIVKSMMGQFSWEQLRNCGYLVGLALVLWAITFALGQGVYLLCGKDARGRILRFSMLYTNFTFVGIPVMETLYGDVGVFYFVVFIVPYRMIYYSSAQPFLSPPGLERQTRSWGDKLRGWFSPPVVAVLVGLVLYLTQFQLPTPVSGVVNSLGGCASPLGMVLCGMTLGKYPITKLLQPGYLLVPLIRNVALPALTLAGCVGLGVPKELAQVIVMFAALPVASLLAAFTIQYDPDPKSQFRAAAAVLYSTLFCAITIPLWAWALTVCYG